MKILIYIIIGCVVYFFLHKFILSKFKLPKIGAITLFTGGVKTGKSAVSLYFAIDTFKRVHRSWWWKCFFIKFANKIFKKNIELPEEPLFYSNIPIAGIKYCELTTAHFLRQVRFNYKSVVFVDEASLVADSTLVKDKHINNALLLFFKLFGHETKGGTCVINSHCITDLHFSIKRCTAEYFYIHSLSNWLIFAVAKAREERYSEDGTDVNVFDKDVEDSLVNIIMWSNIFKRYDCYAFSTLTDNLPLVNNEKYYNKYDSLKATYLATFRPEFMTLDFNKGDTDNETENS